MAIQRFNAVGGYSTGITATAVIDAIGNITGVSGSFSGYVSGSTGFLFGPTSAFLQFIPATSAVNGGMWLKNGLFQIGGSVIGSGIGAVDYSPNNERFHVYGYADFNNSYNYQSGRAPLRLNSAPTQSVPILAAYKQTSDGTQLTTTFTTTNMVAGIDQNGALFSSVGISAAGGVTFAGTLKGVTASFTGLLSASSGISASNATFSSDVYANASLFTDYIFDNTGILVINDKANTRVSIGDYSSNANSTWIYLRDNLSILDLSNPFGVIKLGDPNGIDNNNYISYDTPNALFSGNGQNNLDGFQTISADATILENNRRVTTNARSWFL